MHKTTVRHSTAETKTKRVKGTEWLYTTLEHSHCCSKNPFSHFQFINNPHAAVPFFCMQWNEQPMDFHLIKKPHAAFHFSCMQRKGQPIVETKSEWHQGVCDPGAFKLDHLQSMKPIFAKWISTLLTSNHQSVARTRLSIQNRNGRDTRQQTGT